MRRAVFSLVTAVAACQTGEVGESLAPADAAAPAPDAPLQMRVDAPISAIPDASPAEGCLPGMVRIGSSCIDAYEAYVVELVTTDAGVVEKEHSPYYVVDGLNIRAKVAADVVPQG